MVEFLGYQFVQRHRLRGTGSSVGVEARPRRPHRSGGRGDRGSGRGRRAGRDRRAGLATRALHRPQLGARRGRRGRVLVYWLRKLVFRGAWLDHQVKRGGLEVKWTTSRPSSRTSTRAAGGRCSSSLRLAVARAPVQAVSVAAGCAYLAAPLAVDHYSTYPEQLGLGVLTWAVLFAATTRFPLERRAQALGVVAFATIGEVAGSRIWGVYHYRLHNLPLFVPPAHGIVYLDGPSRFERAPATRTRARPVRRGRRRHLGPARADGAATSRRRRSRGRAYSWFYWRSRNRAVYAAVFVVVASLELYGTAIGTWHWARIAAGARHRRRQPAERRRLWLRLVRRDGDARHSRISSPSRGRSRSPDATSLRFPPRCRVSERHPRFRFSERRYEAASHLRRQSRTRASATRCSASSASRSPSSDALCIPLRRTGTPRVVFAARGWFITGQATARPISGAGMEVAGRAGTHRAAESRGKEAWLPLVEEVPMFCWSTAAIRCIWPTTCGNRAWPTSCRRSTNTSGWDSSAGSMVMTPRIGEDFVYLEATHGADETLGIVDFDLRRRSPRLPETMRRERWAGEPG